MNSRVTVIGAAQVSEHTVKKMLKTNVDMKDVQNVGSLEGFHNVSGDMMLMGYSPNSNKVGLIPASSVSSVKQWAGRKWLKSGSTPTAAGVIGEKDFLASFPQLIGLGCYLVKNDHTRIKLDPTNHYRTIDGQVARLDGSMGHYQWGWGVPFYYATWEDDEYTYEAVSLTEIPGRKNFRIPVASCSASGNATLDRTSDILVSYCNESAQYRGGNNAASKDSGPLSQLGMCATNRTTGQFEDAARKNGDRWTSGFHGMIYIRAVLFRVIMGTRNVQADVISGLDGDGLRRGGLGNGCSYPSDWTSTWGYCPFVPMKAGAELGDYTGVFDYDIKNSDGSDYKVTGIPSFFGLKNFYKYIYVMGGQCIGYDNGDGTMNFYVNPKLDATKLARDVSAMTLAGTASGADGWRYPTKIGSDNLFPTPLENTGTSSTYFCDGFYKDSNTAGSRLCVFGGFALGGASAGLLYLNATYGLSLTSALCGALLCESAEDWDTTGYEVA